jgi:NAD(P)-dependent dehydrogenase (short-subunit alcohol dehydrogenase family)
MKLRNRVAIITGGGSGIGEAVAMRFFEEGSHVGLIDIDIENANRVLKKLTSPQIQCLALRCNVANKAEVDKTFQEINTNLGSPDILVNCAGITNVALLESVTQSDWDRVMDVNLKGYLNCTQAVLRYMRDKGYGKIVNIASLAYLGKETRIAYCTSKAGVIGFTRTAALELAKYEINVNAVSPGFIETPLTRKTIPPESEEYKDIIRRTPLKRAGKPEDIANIVLFLVSDDASFITGQNIIVCGGRSISSAFF